MPVAGGAPRQLVATASQGALTSPADDRVIFSASTPTGWRLMMTDERGAKPVPVPLPPSLHSDGTEFGYARSRDGHRILTVRAKYEIVELDVDGKRPPFVKHRLKRWIVGVTYAADDVHVIASLDFSEGDLWLAEGRFP
jgi:hypothetical protein